MEYFKETTMGKTLVMGRKTWQSLPSSLPGRKKAVISTHFGPSIYVESSLESRTETYTDLHRALDELSDEGVSNDIFIIGGAQIFEAAFNRIQEIHLTRIPGIWLADTFISLDKIEERFILWSTQSIGDQIAVEKYILKTYTG